MKIFSDQSTPSVWKALIAGKYNEVSVESVTGDEASSILNKHPLGGKSPVLQTDQGQIFEANAIARYVARLGKNKLYGTNPHEIGLVEQWIEFASNEIDLAAAVWIFPILGFIPNNEEATQKATGDIQQALDILNRHLLSNTYLVGNRVTLADIVVSMSLFYLYQKVLDPSLRKSYANTNRWYATVVNQPEFQAVLGPVELCKTRAVASASSFVAPPAKEEKKKEKQEKQEKQPKKEQPKKEKAPKPKEDDEEEEESYEDKPKGKNPLDLLPPSKFVLDEWKRKYSNEDKRSIALPWFWQNFDPEGYSIWIGDYKYNHELGKLFMTLNLVNGFIQRLEKLRKYGFGAILILGAEPKNEISCCFLVRGQEMPQEMKECDDVEHYAWRKADINDSATREVINDYWAFDGKVTGKEFHGEGKVFK